MTKLWLINEPEAQDEIDEIVFHVDGDNDTVSLKKVGNVSVEIHDSYLNGTTISFDLLELEKALNKAKELGWY